mgnify:CR=1 FL=1
MKAEHRLGIRENLGQFSLLVLVNAFVGAMIGMERSILPAIAEQEFHLAARSAVLSFIVVFGVTKALTNYLAGRWSDRFGRKHVLVGGWLVAAPVPHDTFLRHKKLLPRDKHLVMAMVADFALHPLADRQHQHHRGDADHDAEHD